MNTTYFYNRDRNRAGNICRIIAITAVVQLTFLFQSCDSFTEVDMPVTELNTPAVFEQKNTAYAAMTDVYAKMRENGIFTGKPAGTGREMGLYADELTWYGSSTSTSNSFFNNTVLPSTGTITGWWNHSYNQIYSANAVIEGVAASNKLQQEDKNQLTGEALFVRGLLHFHLMQLFGEVPYITSTDYNINKSAGRMTTASMYEKIVEDLEAARELLPDEYPNPERVRPNSFVATAVLARVQLSKGDYAAAANSASAVLNRTDIYSLPVDLDAVFLKESSSTIWQFSPRVPTRNTDEGSTFIFNSAPPPNAAITASLYDSFETGDQRRVKWLRPRSSGGNIWYHSFKYKKTTTSSPQLEYSIVIRLAEMFLIRAEARARQGELVTAKDDLNIIRNAAGLDDTVADSQEELLDAILHERRVEFFTEYGHRFMDLKRFGKLDQFLSGKPAWQSSDRLLPIPEAELSLNPNIRPQNPGY